jgi:hypothetical protein
MDLPPGVQTGMELPDFGFEGREPILELGDFLEEVLAFHRHGFESIVFEGRLSDRSEQLLQAARASSRTGRCGPG